MDNGRDSTKQSAIAEPCVVKLQIFEGPLDLLLHLIKKNEMDIYDISIAKITEQYIEYLEFMKELNLEFAGEYLVIAAELSLIKSRMLLPKPVIEEEEEDPRTELIRRLLEYQVYKDAAEELTDMDILGRDIFKRDVPLDPNDINEEIELVPVNMWSLIEAFREFYNRRSHAWAEDVKYVAEGITLEEKIDEILIILKANRDGIEFFDLFDDSTSKFDLIITFLALLELIRGDNVSVSQQSHETSILISYRSDVQAGAN